MRQNTITVSIIHAFLLLMFLSYNLIKPDTLDFLHIFLKYALQFLDDIMDKGSE